MKKLILIFSVTLKASCLAQTYDIFILAGQSNASGRSPNINSETPNSDVPYFYDTDGPTDTDYTSSTWEGMKRLGTNADYHGVEISASNCLTGLGYNPAFIKVSTGGTSLHINWNAETGGDEWVNLSSQVSEALGQFNASGVNYNVRGFFWVHGERDSNFATFSQNYEQNLNNLVDGLEILTGSSVKTVAPLLSEKVEDVVSYRTVVNQAVIDFVDSDPDDRGYINTDDLSIHSEGDGGLHYTSSSLDTLGCLMAEEFARLDSIPEPSSTALLGLGALGLLTRRKR